MATLFEQSSINGLTLSNRVVRSATNESLATEDGKATPELITLLTDLVKGGVGLIISGHAAVSLEGQANLRQLLAHDDACLPSLASIAEAVHAAGGKIALQISHGGIFANPSDPQLLPVGASLPAYDPAVLYREIGLLELDLIIEKFAAAAKRAQKAGFDAVQVHAAHTYFLSQFTSFFFNKRTDMYGGSVENRARLLLRVIEAIRATVGTKFPVLVKINSEDFLEGGLSQEDSLHICTLLEHASVDCIELSGGAIPASAKFSAIRRGPIKTAADEVFYRHAAVAYKKKLGIPLMLVGGIRSKLVAEALLQDGVADYIALSRPLICEPNLVQQWQLGTTDKAACTSDNACFSALRKGEGLSCVTFAKK